jgi:hypothetical protein
MSHMNSNKKTHQSNLGVRGELLFTFLYIGKGLDG